ncbi:MAG TPA: hypothetical protein VED40_17825 [Azospirillaceae bacterium]|nr:hypothetical protein [Azospirillaceae bacterium]
MRPGSHPTRQGGNTRLAALAVCLGFFGLGYATGADANDDRLAREEARIEGVLSLAQRSLSLVGTIAAHSICLNP